MNFWSKRPGRVRHSEEWFASLYPKMPFSDMSDAASCSGPDEAFLRQLASRSNKPSLPDPRVAHVANCLRCMQRLRSFQQEEEKKRRFHLSIWAVATAILVIALGVSFYRYHNTQPEQFASVTQTLDLSGYGTTRGSPTTLPLLALPRRVVTVSMILPQFSEPGSYSVSVLETKEASPRAQATGVAVQAGPRTSLTVKLDLRTAKPGRYYISTTHGTDAAAYYYPLQIVR